MSNKDKHPVLDDPAYRTALHLQALEGNPLDADDVAMFEMFERENWPPEKRRAYIIEQAKNRARVFAAE